MNCNECLAPLAPGRPVCFCLLDPTRASPTLCIIIIKTNGIRVLDLPAAFSTRDHLLLLSYLACYQTLPPYSKPKAPHAATSALLLSPMSRYVLPSQIASTHPLPSWLTSPSWKSRGPALKPRYRFRVLIAIVPLLRSLIARCFLAGAISIPSQPMEAGKPPTCRPIKPHTFLGTLQTQKKNHGCCLL